MKHLGKRMWLLAVGVVGALAVTTGAFGYVATDQADYTPGSVVTISGGNDVGGLPGYVVGNTVSVDATADNGLWADSCTATVAADETWSCQVTLSSDPAIAVGSYTYTATSTAADGSPISESGTFTDAAYKTMTYTAAGTGSGTVTFKVVSGGTNPSSGTGGCSVSGDTAACTASGTFQYINGDSYTITASAGIGSSFAGWSGESNTAACGTNTSPCTTGAMNGSGAAITATFNVAVSPDTTAPVITFDQTPNGSNGWFKTAPATVTVTATDSDDGGVASLACKLDGTAVTLTSTGSTATTKYGDVSTSTDGNHTVSCQAADSTGNTAYYADNTTALKLDTVAPAITITTPADGASYILGQSVTADFGCTDGTSGVASCIGTVADDAAIDTSTIGSKSFTVNAGDNAGNTNTKTVNYKVIYNFTGFFQPVDNGDTCNVAKAGSAIPIKFSLDGYQGMDIIAAGYPKALNGTCAGIPLDPVETTSTAGNSTLNYDATTDQYIYVWKTQKAWAGKAIKLDVELADGEHYYARFTFTK